MRAESARRALAFTLTTLTLALTSAAGCQQVIGIPDRTTRENVSCNDGVCACEAGFGDCNGSLKDGCEVTLATSQNDCGACGAVCANGTCAEGRCGCLAGFDDCDADPQNGCETALDVTSTSCGVCGHDCLGAPCAASLCGPAKLCDATNPEAISVGGGYVYYTAFDIAKGSFVMRVPVGGGAPETFATFPAAAPLRGLRLTATAVVVFTDHGLHRVDLATRAKKQIYDAGAKNILDLVATDTQLVLAEGAMWTPDELFSVDWATGVGTSITTDVSQDVGNLAIARDKVYWTNAAGTLSMLEGGAPVAVANGPTDVAEIVADDDYLFVQAYKPSDPNITFERISLADGSVVQSTIDPGAHAVVPVHGEAYWFQDDDKLIHWTESGATTLAEAVVTIQNAGTAVDDVAVYGGGPLGIFRVAR